MILAYCSSVISITANYTSYIAVVLARPSQDSESRTDLAFTGNLLLVATGVAIPLLFGNH